MAPRVPSWLPISAVVLGALLWSFTSAGGSSEVLRLRAELAAVRHQLSIQEDLVEELQREDSAAAPACPPPSPLGAHAEAKSLEAAGGRWGGRRRRRGRKFLDADAEAEADIDADAVAAPLAPAPTAAPAVTSPVAISADHTRTRMHQDNDTLLLAHRLWDWKAIVTELLQLWPSIELSQLETGVDNCHNSAMYCQRFQIHKGSLYIVDYRAIFFDRHYVRACPDRRTTFAGPVAVALLTTAPIPSIPALPNGAPSAPVASACIGAGALPCDADPRDTSAPPRPPRH